MSDKNSHKQETQRLRDRLVKSRQLVLKLSKENYKHVDWIRRAKVVIPKLKAEIERLTAENKKLQE